MECIFHYIHVALGDGDGHTKSHGYLKHERFFTDEHLTHTCDQKEILACETSHFSTLFLINKVESNPCAGQYLNSCLINYRR